MPLDSGPALAAVTGRTRVRRRRIRNLSIVAIIAVIGVGAGVAFAGSATEARYRTASVSEQATSQLLNGVGTIEPVSQATVGFPAAGTVASVAVQAGDIVTTGTELATLDEASLEQAVHQAQASVDQATLTLERARNGQSATSTGPSADGGATQPISFTSDVVTTSDAVAAVSDQDLTAAQQAVLDAQQQVDHDLTVADQAYASAQQICASINSTTSSDASTQPAASANDDITACSNALDQVLDAQHQVSSSQGALATASTALDRLLAQRAAELASTGGGPTTEPNATNSNGSTPTGSSSTRTSTSPSAADLAADQKAVDAADAKLAVAQQALLQATILSPIDGTVVAVNMAAGDVVAAGSSTATIVIAGSGGYEAVTIVKVTDLPRLKVGQPASVQPDGADSTLTGKISSIGLVSTSSTTGTTYPVTIGLTGDTSRLHNGGTATTAITTAASASGLAVPSSAVRTNNGTHTVVVLDGNSTRDVTVQVGAIGPEWTEIKSGLSVGDTVVLADLEQPLPTSATASSNGQQQNPFAGRGGFVVPAN